MATLSRETRNPGKTGAGEEKVMCGRFTQKAKPRELAERFEVPEVPLFEPRYNIAPTQAVPVVRATPEGRELALLRWGLIPSWADDPAVGSRMINARAETVAVKPAYRSAFRKRWCLIPASGFYEWASEPGRKKQPIYFRMKDEAPFAFAGLWEVWSKGPEPVESCTLITTTPNELVAPVHDRMPAIVEPQDYGWWLDPRADDPAALAALLGPYPAAEMVAYPVGRLVNDPRHDGPDCIAPLSA
jgi:putative SOS response-associated peptidase YedK